MMMNTASIHFDIPKGLLHSLNQSEAEFASQVRLMSAMQLFEDQKLTLGQAIELANISREQFLLELDKYKIPVINYDPADLEMELKGFES
ncbi:MAG: UPF0175 family protein [Anaerolineae bacterium]|nr:UPF0175 family protein [Anaerolineae bacterium]